MSLSRRRFLQSAFCAAALALAFAQPVAAKDVELEYGAPRPFSFDGLKARAEKMAQEVYISPARPMPEVVQKIDYMEHGAIRFKDQLALFADHAGASPVTFFHLGRLFPRKVTINVVEDGKAREVMYDDAYFDMPADSPAHKLSSDSGFAGFRFHEVPDGSGKLPGDWIAFLGASYFRAIGETRQYGLSARGIAVNTAVPGKGEEFPDFREFWIETPAENSHVQVVYALLDGPSVSGAYKFTLQREAGLTVDVEQHLYLRKDVDQLGIAPLTSMFWFSETKRPILLDWRPEVHDSDGVQLLTGNGERIWRPLNNAPRVLTSSFTDENPRGFGLMQRDNNFEHFLDGVHYERRPSVWIEPAGNWGKGEVQLVEIPTDDEYHDNIVLFWKSAEPARRGSSFSYNYRMRWRAADSLAPDTGHVIATRIGRSFKVHDAYPPHQWKFVVEFTSDKLARLPADVKPEIVFTASRGKLVDLRIDRAAHDPSRWFAQFDLNVEGAEPAELRCYLKNGDEVLSETWLYQFHPEKS